MNKNLLMDLDIRLGYGDSITLSRDEYNNVIHLNSELIQNFNNQIDDLSGCNGELEDDNSDLRCLVEELTEKVTKLKNEIKELKEKNNV